MRLSEESYARGYRAGDNYNFAEEDRQVARGQRLRDAARVFADKGIYLLGNESQTVGPEDAPMEVHKILLSKDVVLLEGLRLSNIEQGEYFLSAAPINIAGSDGAPCRAVLIKF